jgi:FixJ family two-component response regulator
MSKLDAKRSDLPVLVVEDDPEVRCLLQREIQDQGHPVTVVPEAEQALEALSASTYAVVITDIRMPGMDGVELTRRIKQSAPDTEVILITGYASIDTASTAVRLGAADYLQKPLGDISRIHESLDRALERHQQRAQTLEHISQLEARQRVFAHLLDRLPMGLALIARDGHVLHLNRAAGAILGEHDGLSLTDDKQLRASRHDDTLRLQSLIQTAGAAVTNGRGRRGGAAKVDRPSGRTALSVVVTPLHAENGELSHDEAAAALFVSDPDRRVATAEDLLCRLYALTPTEARLAAVLMQGKSVEEAATELNVSTNTARTHLKRIFGKTGTSRQGDLISLLLSGPALLRLEEDS